MAWKQAISLGVGDYSFKCAILQESILSAIVSSGVSWPYFSSSNAASNAFNHLYTDLGENITDILKRSKPSYEWNIIASLGDIDFATDKSWVSDTKFGAVGFNFYKKGTTNQLAGILDHSGGGIYMNNKPARLSVLYDDDRELAAIINANFYADNKCRVYNICTGNDTLGNEQRTYQAIREYIGEIDNDPWADNNYADIGGGDGTLDITSNKISIPDFPLSLVDTGFIQIFTPTLTQLNDLADYMWNGSFLDNLIKLWNNPMDILISLSQLPVNISTDKSRIVHAGNVITTVYMNYPDHQFVDIDCGSLEIKPFYDSYLDYDPYTSCDIYLPYIGYQTLSMDEIMGKTLNVKYRVDLITGTCVANILCNDSVIYVFTGNCASNIPLSMQSYASLLQSAINIGVAGGTAKKASVTSKGQPVPSQKPNAIASSLASNVLSSKLGIERSGSVSANAGMFAPQKPFLLFTVARICLPKNQNTYLGYPVFISTKISNLKGYTEIDEIRLDKVTCTEEEKKEILDILKGGFIV